MKKTGLTAIALAAVLLMPLLAGCGNTAPAEPTPTEKPYRTGIYGSLTTEEVAELALQHSQPNFEAMDELGITHDEGSTKGNYPYWDLTEDDPIEEYNKQYELCIAMYEKLITMYESETEYAEKRLTEIYTENEPAGEWYYSERISGYAKLMQECRDEIAAIETLMENGEKKVLLKEHEGPLDGPDLSIPSTRWLTQLDRYLEYPDGVIYEWTGDSSPLISEQP